MKFLYNYFYNSINQSIEFGLKFRIEKKQVLISFVCKQSIPDTQCGYRYIRCNVLRELCLTCNEFEIETEILMKACKKNFAVFSIPIKTIYSNEVSQINPFRDTVRFFVYFIRELCFNGK